MNIKRAKKELTDTIQAYLQKDEYNDYIIPAVRQRPILLMGPPGIGKTQIMEQIARECSINLVSYTITHHTRQSAVGLPFIQEKTYAGIPHSVTEYTMSEIISAVYDKIEQTGIREGILFLDEINCVSETLAPAMLQFLQNKTFGNQKVPDGWIIAAAGNPPEYNKSVRDFDIVTLDRIRKIDVEENLDAWREYARKESIHPAILTYLDLKRDCFYKIETTIDGKLFVTARGWEDLSHLLWMYEKLEKPVDRDVIIQYLQHPKIAKDFANYLELYKKYKKDYGLEEILNGHIPSGTLDKLAFAPFDERLCVIGLLTARLEDLFKEYWHIDQYVSQLYEWLKKWSQTESPDLLIKKAETSYETDKKAGFLTKSQDRLRRRILDTLYHYQTVLNTSSLAPEQQLDKLRSLFQQETELREKIIAETALALTHAFDFMEAAFGDSQEMVVFVTALNTGFYSISFINENGSDRYYKYNQKLQLHETHQEILRKLTPTDL